MVPVYTMAAKILNAKYHLDYYAPNRSFLLLKRNIELYATMLMTKLIFRLKVTVLQG